MALVELARFNKLVDGEIARTFLESHGIQAFVFDSGLNSAEGGGMATAVRIMVLDDDLDEAASLLAESGSR